MKHVHHINPRYRGGSNDPSNLIELTVTQHTMWHFLWGNEEDKIAAQGLAGIISHEESVQKSLSLGGKRAAKTLRGRANAMSKQERVDHFSRDQSKAKFRKVQKLRKWAGIILINPSGEIVSFFGTNHSIAKAAGMTLRKIISKGKCAGWQFKDFIPWGCVDSTSSMDAKVTEGSVEPINPKYRR